MNFNFKDPNYSYKHEIIKILPTLRILDDEITLNISPVSAMKGDKKNRNNKNDANQQCPFDDDWQLINQWIEEGIGPPEEKLAINESQRPGTSSSRGSRTSTSVRPLSSMRPLSSYRIKTALNTRPNSRMTTSNSSGGLNTASSRNSTANNNRPSSDSLFDPSTDASHLTVGPTIQGNPLRALMSRRKNQPSTPNTDKNDVFNEDVASVMNKKPPTYKSALKSLNQEENNLKIENEELRQEIQKWKREHAK